MAVNADDSPRLLIVRRDNIGDLVCTTPLIDALRARLPNAWLGALVTTYNAEVLSRNAALSEIFVYEKLKHRSGSLLSHLRSRLGQLARMRRQSFDCVLVPAPAPQAMKLARGLKPRRVIAAPVGFPAGMHEAERTFELGREFGVGGTPGPLRVFPDMRVVRELEQTIGAGPYAAVHISARRPAQRWPLERYVQLIRHLSKKQKVMLLWAPGARDNLRHPGDDVAASEILRAAAGSAVVPVATPDVTTLVAALSLAECVVCPDGGAMHIAAALGKPVVALFGDSAVARWRPWGVPYRVVRPDSRNLADLQLEPVLEAWGELASGNRPE